MPPGESTIAHENQGKLPAAARLALFAAAATQVILLPAFFFPFVTTRNIFFRLCVELALAAVLLFGVRRLRDVDVKRDLVLRWFAIYVVAIGVCAVAGLAPWHSMFGDFERMGGVLAWLHLFLFYCLLRILMRPKDWTTLFSLYVLVADLVVLWGATEFLPVSIQSPMFRTLAGGSTTGNQGLLGAYLLLALALAACDIGRGQRGISRKISLVSVPVLLFGIVGSRNRSSELGLLVGIAVAAAVFLFYATNRKRIAARMAVAATAAIIAFGAVAALVGTEAPKMARRFGGRWIGFLSSPARLIEWKIAIQGFRDRPLFGFGPENHQIVASHHFDPHIYDVLSESAFDRAHNAWLELLATSGIIGTVAMLGIWLGAVITIHRGVREKSLSRAEGATLIGALAAYATYLTFWFFDVNSVILWVILLVFVSSRVNGRLDVLTPHETRSSRNFAWACVMLTVLAAYLQNIVPLRAAHDLAVGGESGPFNTRLNAFENVLYSSTPQTLHTFPMYYQFLRNAAPEMSQPGTDPILRKEFALAMQRGFIEAQRSIARNKSDDRSYVDVARFLSLAGIVYADKRYVRGAKTELLKAVSISPRRPDVRVLLAGVCLALEDTVAASAQLDTAMALNRRFSPAFVYASRLALMRGNIDSSASLLATGVSGTEVPPVSFASGVLDSLRAHGEDARAATIAGGYIASELGPDSAWYRLVVRSPRDSFAIQLAESLPILYLKAGDAPAAIKAAKRLAVLQPASRSAVAQFQSDVLSGRSTRWTTAERVFPPTAINASGTAVR